MDFIVFTKALFVYLNICFMIAGIFLNSVVIVSFLKSFKLRHDVCYFMILVLSCFDLAVNIINHPLLIFLRILLSVQTDDQGNVEFTKHQESIIVSLEWVKFSIVACSMLALLTLNIERLLALRYPYFHHSAVTRSRLVSCLLISITFLLLPSFPYHQINSFAHVFAILIFWLVCVALMCLNYNMALIARSVRKNERNISKAVATNNYQQRKRRKKTLKTISICFMVVACFLICSLPQIIYTLYNCIMYEMCKSEEALHVLIFNLWASASVSFNSTFNCLLFFWKNSILRREGKKIIGRWLLTSAP